MRKKFFIFFTIFYVLALISSLVQGQLIRAVLTLAAAISLWFAFRLINNSLVNPIDTPLTSQEKKVVLITEFFNPIVGLFYYYSWKKFLPTKARQANIYLWVTLLIELLLGLVLFILLMYTKSIPLLLLLST